MADRYLLESGAPDGYLLEDGSGVLLLDNTPQTLLVVAATGALTAGDTELQSWLTGMGHNVTLRDGSASDADANTFSVVVLAESLASGTILAKYKGAATGVVHCENGAWDDMGLITGAAGTQTAQTQMVITSAVHSIKGSVSSGTVTLYTAASDLKHSSATHGANATMIARAPVAATSWTIFCYEAGVVIADGSVAAGRRVAFSMSDSTGAAVNSNADGQALFENAVNWALGQETDPPGSIPPGNILFLVASATSLNASETAIKARLEGQGHTVGVADDDSALTSWADGRDLLIVSKTITSTAMGNKFHNVTCGVIFWEDNAQAEAFFGTISTVDVTATFWHFPDTDVVINASALTELKAGLSGTVVFLDTNLDITYAPKTDGGLQTLNASAIKVAEFNTGGSGQWSLYAYETGSTMGDGTNALGRRYYFGLYDDTFVNLTADGLALWDAAVVWASGGVGAVVTVPHRSRYVQLIAH